MITLLLLAIAVFAVAFVWFMRQINPPGREGPEVTIEIPGGLSNEQVATLLADERVVTSAGAFSVYSRIRGTGEVREGEYLFRERQNMNDVIAVLRAGPKVVEYKLTIPEGFTISQIAARVGEDVPTISEDDFLAAVASGAVVSKYMPPGATSMEGFLFPDTYVVGEKTTAEDLLRKMVERFDEMGTAVGIGGVAGYTAYDVLIIASMIEKEAKIPDERPMVSRVIYNRLAAGMPLGIDATLLYTKPSGQALTQADLQADGPYNTRVRTGLPATPISNPGRDSLDAAAHPAEGNWLYYVIANPDGHHAFSESYDEFLENKERAQEQGLL